MERMLRIIHHNKANSNIPMCNKQVNLVQSSKCRAVPPDHETYGHYSLQRRTWNKRGRF